MLKILYITSDLVQDPTDGGQIAGKFFYDSIKNNTEYEVNVINLHNVDIKKAITGKEILNILSHRQKKTNKLKKILEKVTSIFSIYNRSLSAFNSQDLGLVNFDFENFDFIIFNGFISLRLFKFSIKTSKIIYIAHNIEQELIKNKIRKSFFSRIYARLEYFKTKLYEDKILKIVDSVICLSKSDSVFIKKYNNNINIIPPFIKPVSLDKKVFVESFGLIATNLEHDPNIISLDWFFDKVYPFLDHNIKIIITGKGSFEQYQSKNYKNIEFRGFVSREELDDLYQKAGFVINPTVIGSGIQIKLIEALSMSKKIISTQFSNKVLDTIPSSDDPQIFAELINNYNLSSSIDIDYNKIYNDNQKKLFNIFQE